MKIDFSTTSHYCSGPNIIDLGHSKLFINIIVLILAVLSLFLSVKYIYQVAKDYIQYTNLYKKAKEAALFKDLGGVSGEVNFKF